MREIDGFLRLANLRKSVLKFCFCKLVLTCVVGQGLSLHKILIHLGLGGGVARRTLTLKNIYNAQNRPCYTVQFSMKPVSRAFSSRHISRKNCTVLLVVKTTYYPELNGLTKKEKLNVTQRDKSKLQMCSILYNYLWYGTA